MELSLNLFIFPSFHLSQVDMALWGTSFFICLSMGILESGPFSFEFTSLTLFHGLFPIYFNISFDGYTMHNLITFFIVFTNRNGMDSFNPPPSQPNRR